MTDPFEPLALGHSMRTGSERLDVSIFVGTHQEVRNKLDQLPAKHLLVVSFDHVKESDPSVVIQAFVSMGAMLSAVVERHDKEFMEQLAGLLVPRTPPSPRLLREAAMQIRARKAALESGDLVTASQIVELAGLSALNASAQPNKWKKLGQIFAVHHNGVDYFPGYGLDPETGFRPLKVLATVIKAFEGIKDGWGLAYWFSSDNSFLGGKRPQDVLKFNSERVIAAAIDEVEEVADG